MEMTYGDGTEMTLITKKTVLPGDPGTKRLLDIYGDRLVCVRYKYDIERGLRYKTIELIIEKEDWAPDSNRIPANKIVKVYIDVEEREIRRKVKSFGGKFNWNEKLWELRYEYILQLGLESRIKS